MRKVVLYELMSLDGVIEDPDAFFVGSEDGSLPAFDQAMDDYLGEVIGRQDAVLLGRGMFEEWARFWPGPGAKIQPFADFINNVRKYVVTSRPLETTWPNVEAVSAPLEPLIADLKSRPGGDIGVHGSVQLAQSLVGANLVDEIRLEVSPSFGFPGRRLFADAASVRRLELIHEDRSPTGTMLLGYRVRSAT